MPPPLLESSRRDHVMSPHQFTDDPPPILSYEYILYVPQYSDSAMGPTVNTQYTVQYHDTVEPGHKQSNSIALVCYADDEFAQVRCYVIL